MSQPAVTSRRERKKAATRQALAEAALRLFLENGYEAVTVAQIAEAADTAVTTLFAHFPDGKESLIFGPPPPAVTAREDRGTLLVAAIENRPTGTRAIDAIEAFISDRGPFAENPPPDAVRQLRLIADTPPLRAYARTQWLRTADALAGALAQASERDPHDTAITALARFTLEAPDLAADGHDPRQALHTIFDHLRAGWPEL